MGLSLVVTSGEYQRDISQIVCIVIYSLFQLRHKYITWPTSTERRLESLENQMKKGFTGAIIGKVDGTDIILLYKPEGDLVGRTLLYQEKPIFNRPLRYL